MNKNTITAICVILLTFLTTLTTTSYFNGFPEHGNEWAKFALLILAGKGLIIVIGAICMIATLRAIAKRDHTWKWAALLGLVAALLFWGLRPLTRTLFFLGIQSDLQKHNVADIRREVAELLTQPHNDNLDGYFGELLTSNMVPPHLRNLSADGMYVRTTDGVVIRMDGLGSWRGGFLFLPPGGTCTEKQSEKVMPGVYYVISK